MLRPIVDDADADAAAPAVHRLAEDALTFEPVRAATEANMLEVSTGLSTNAVVNSPAACFARFASARADRGSSWFGHQQACTTGS